MSSSSFYDSSAMESADRSFTNMQQIDQELKNLYAELKAAEKEEFNLQRQPNSGSDQACQEKIKACQEKIKFLLSQISNKLTAFNQLQNGIATTLNNLLAEQKKMREAQLEKMGIKKLPLA